VRALVTGSKGFVGRHFVEYLKDAGWDTWCVDNHEQVQVDLSSRFDVRLAHTWPTTPRFDLVVHAAAYVGGRFGIEGTPTHLAAYNAQLDGALVDWALRAEPEHLVLLSSSAAYPVDFQGAVFAVDGRIYDVRQPYRLREADIEPWALRMPDRSYGWAKLALERLGVEYAAETGRHVHVVRPFSGYGTDQGVDYPFGAFLERALLRRDPFGVWGSGDAVRDWVHIDDVVATVMAMVEQGHPGPLNVCTGRPVDFDELACMFADAVGYRPILTHLYDRPEGVMVRVGDPTLMRQVRESTIEIEDGIRRAVRDLS
jgi:nucleoside-diphosphate-sugar epimerase